MKNMKNSKNKNNGVSVPEIFFVWSDELQDRFDPFFYRPVFKNLLEVIANNKTEKITLKEAIIDSVAGDWGEDPIDFEPNPDYELCYVVRNTNFHNDFNLDFSDVAQRYIKKSKAEKLALKKGDILIEKSGGSPIQPVGRVALIDDLPFDKPVVFSNFLQKMEVNQELFLPEYIFVYLQALYKTGYMDFIQNQTTGIKNLRLDDFFKILVIKPSIAEQKKVAQKAIKSREEAKGLLEKAKTILASIDKFVLDELGIEMPEGGAERVYSVWSDLLLGGRLDAEYYNPFYDLFYKKLSKGKYQLARIENVASDVFQGVGKKETENPEFTLLKVKNIKKNNEIDFEDTEFVESVPENKVLQSGDILSPFIGEAVRQCKFSVFENGERKFAVDNNTGVIRVDSTKANSEYIAYALNSQIGNTQLKHLIGGGGVPFLGSENARKLKIPLPPVAIQKKIVDKIKEQHDKARNLRQEAETVIAEAQKQTAEMIFA